MPIVNGVTTKSARSVWKSPDGQREIFEVMFDVQGKEFKAKTYSSMIAGVGWSGDVQAEERIGRNGSETFVKQPPKENPGYSSTTGNSSKSNYVPKDEKAIQAMWAIGQSIAAHNGNDGLDVAELESVKAYAIELFAMVDDVKGAEAVADEPKTEPVDEVVTVTDEPLDLSEIDKVFGKSGDTPWPTKT